MPHRRSFPPAVAVAACAAARRFRCDGVEFDVAEQHAWRDGEPVCLTDCEWTLLVALARGGGHPMSRSALLALLARPGPGRSANALNIHLCNLRRKLGSDLIQTVRGRGYRLVAPRAIEARMTPA